MNHSRHIFSAVIALLLSTAVFASATRTIRTINDGWKFTKEGVSQQVHLPHSWNAVDADDDVEGFWRGECTYEKNLRLGDEIDSKNVYLRFEGAYQETRLFVNGKAAGEHLGGYTAFIFDITDLVIKGDNAILVKVDNKYNENIPTLTADYTFFGGIYRDVELIIAPKVLISPDVYASSGVFLSTPSVSAEKASVKAVTYLTNSSGEKKTVVLEQTLISPNGNNVVTVSKKLKLEAGSERIPYEQTFEILSPKMWDVDAPEVYTVRTSVYQAGKKDNLLIDRVSNPLGFRTFSFDPNKGFTLNGRHLKIMGTNRHQDFMWKGNALPDEYHERDVLLLKEMGGNFLRISHYPQDPVIVDECDRQGIVNSVEIPIVNSITMSEEFSNCCVEMAKEMVCQGYNHPSTIIWAYMNEVLLRLPFKRTAPMEEKRPYYDYACSIGQKIDDAIKSLDSLRPTMIPCNSSAEVYKESLLGEIPDILGWNLYSGWYGGQFSDFAKAMDKIHSMFPDKSIIVSEYGADNDIRIHSFAGERFDFSVEYGNAFHKAYIPVILNRDYIAGSNVWNLADFYSEVRGDAIPHINCKGLVTRDRNPKDSYYLYKAVLSKTPVLSLSGKDWLVRGGDEGVSQPFDVYTNLSAVELFVNGKSVGVKKAENGYATFDVVFKNGENSLVAKAGDLTDAMLVKFRAVPTNMKNFSSMNVTMGKCFFEDKNAGAIWIPTKEYASGSWGTVGGRAGRQKTSRGSQPRSNLDVFDCREDMLFQTQWVGIEAFKADVPDGQYYVYLYFSEMNAGSNQKKVVYNLGNDAVGTEISDRIFDVSINGSVVIPALDIRKEVGAQRPMVKKISVNVENGVGLTVGFTPIKGETVLDAIRIYRCN